MAPSVRRPVPYLVLTILVGCTANKAKTGCLHEKDQILQRLADLEERFLQQDMGVNQLSDLERRLHEQGAELASLQERVLQQDVLLKRQETQIHDQKEIILKLQQRMTLGSTGHDDLDKYARLNKQHRKDNNLQTRSDDISGWEPIVTQMNSQITQMKAEIQALKNANQLQDQSSRTALSQLSQAIGTSYVRWGHHACPNSSDILYSGTIGGSHFTHSGAASNYLCLPPNPVFDDHAGGGAQLWGAEYETMPEPTQNLLPKCAVCRTSRSAVIMVPAVKTCESGWTLEYSGYLMAGAYSYHGTEYICVDAAEEYVEGTNADDNGKLLYYTRTVCGSLPCPPYVNDKMVLCAVCSK